MKETKHNVNKFPQRGGRYSLQDYYLALKYRNLDLRMEELAWGIIHKIDQVRKAGKSSGQEGLLKSILAECLEVTPCWVENKLELFVTSINVPNDLKGAFLPEKKFKFYNPTTKENTKAENKNSTAHRQDSKQK